MINVVRIINNYTKHLENEIDSLKLKLCKEIQNSQYLLALEKLKNKRLEQENFELKNRCNNLSLCIFNEIR